MFPPEVRIFFASLLLVCSESETKVFPPCERYICIVKTTTNRYEPYVFAPRDVDPTLCTHVFLYGAELDGNKLKTPYWNDDKGPGGVYDQLTQLKETNKLLKVLLTVGLRDLKSKSYSKMVATESARKEFIDFLIPFLRDRGFDGIDLLWYAPTFFSGAKLDKERYVDLIRELATAFEDEPLLGEREKLILSAWGAKEIMAVRDGFNVTAFARYVDMLTIATVNYEGFVNQRLSFHTPLRSRLNESIKDSVGYWVDLGMPKTKINIELAAYGKRVYTKSAGDMNVQESIAVGFAPAGKYTNLSGVLAHYEICSLLKEGGKVYWNSFAQSTYHIVDKYFLTYDDEESLQHKVRFVRENGLGGVALHDLDEDDFKGIECGKGTYPLARAIKAECLKSME